MGFLGTSGLSNAALSVDHHGVTVRVTSLSVLTLALTVYSTACPGVGDDVSSVQTGTMACLGVALHRGCRVFVSRRRRR